MLFTVRVFAELSLRKVFLLEQNTDRMKSKLLRNICQLLYTVIINSKGEPKRFNGPNCEKKMIKKICSSYISITSHLY